MTMLRSLLVFFFLVTLSAGDAKPVWDQPVTFDFAGTFLQDAAEALSEDTGAQIQVDPVVQQRGHSLWFKAKGMSFRNALGWITELSGTTYAEKDGRILISERVGQAVVPAPDKVIPPAIKKSLDALVTVDLKVERDLQDAFGFLCRLNDLTIVMSLRLQATEPRARVKADGQALSSILDQIAKSCGATWVVRNQAVFFDLASGAAKQAP